MPKFSFPWDEYSDQPHVIADKKVKKAMYKLGRLDQLKMVVVSLLVLPIAYILRQTPFLKNKKKIDLSEFFGLCVNLNANYNKEVIESVKELGCQQLIVRIYLHDIENLENYRDFVNRLPLSTEVIIAVLQDRRHIEDLALFRRSMTAIFEAFHARVKRYQIGHAINRKKWGFITYDEFLEFYRVAQGIRDEEYPNVALIGPSIIDYEYFATARVLFNNYRIKFDEVGSLLYVDRRGAPENKQFGLGLIGKIKHLKSIVKISPKVGGRFLITETNWPIKGKGLYSPTSEKECVSLDDYVNYMVRYYLLALSTGEVHQVFWHQLVAPGYGLVDDRHGFLKYPAYHAFKTMLSLLQGGELVGVKRQSNKSYTFSIIDKAQEKRIDVLWCLADNALTLDMDSSKTYLDVMGEPIHSQSIVVKQSPVYIVAKL